MLFLIFFFFFTKKGVAFFRGRLLNKNWNKKRKSSYLQLLIADLRYLNNKHFYCSV